MKKSFGDLRNIGTNLKGHYRNGVPNPHRGTEQSHTPCAE